MEEVQAASASSAEALSTAKAEITIAKKELQALSLELQTLINLVCVRVRACMCVHACVYMCGWLAGGMDAYLFYSTHLCRQQENNHQRLTVDKCK